jgi:SAM-dependent methyltransferase
MADGRWFEYPSPVQISNPWNRARYRLWAPVYDLMAPAMARARENALREIAVAGGERVLVAGAGTGLDLPHLPAPSGVVATDLTPAMLARARRRAPACHFVLGDAQQLPFADAVFDVVLLHFIVTVVGSPAACLREAARVTRPGGRLSVLDKFVPDCQAPSSTRRWLNVLSRVTFSDLTVDLSAALREAAAPLKILSRRPVALGGRYEAIVLRRKGAEASRSAVGEPK